MDTNWPDLIFRLIEMLLVGGGLVVIVTISDKKTAAALENVSKIGDTYNTLQDQMKENYDGLIEQKDKYAAGLQEMIANLKEEVEAKNSRITEQNNRIEEMYKANNELLHQVGQLKVLGMRRCDVFNCTSRRPPLDAGIIIDKEVNRKHLTKDNKGRFYKAPLETIEEYEES